MYIDFTAVPGRTSERTDCLSLDIGDIVAEETLGAIVYESWKVNSPNAFIYIYLHAMLNHSRY
jgi:hypothetical protein